MTMSTTAHWDEKEAPTAVTALRQEVGHLRERVDEAVARTDERIDEAVVRMERRDDSTRGRVAFLAESQVQREDKQAAREEKMVASLQAIEIKIARIVAWRSATFALMALLGGGTLLWARWSVQALIRQEVAETIRRTQ